jgi:hypothetical protein
MQKIVYANFGIEPKPTHILYGKPYLDYFDMVPFPQGFRVPLLSSLTGYTIRQFGNISQYRAQLGEAEILILFKCACFLCL